jgi:hypothetical protein
MCIQAAHGTEALVSNPGIHVETSLPTGPNMVQLTQVVDWLDDFQIPSQSLEQTCFVDLIVMFSPLSVTLNLL